MRSKQKPTRKGNGIHECYTLTRYRWISFIDELLFKSERTPCGEIDVRYIISYFVGRIKRFAAKQNKGDVT